MGVKKNNPAAATPKKGAAGPKEKGGAKKGRKLLRWNDSHEKRLLLSIQFCCSEKGIILPWDMIGEYVEGVSAGAIQQHLAKIRQRLQEWGSDVPPPLRRGTPHTSSFVAERINHAPGASTTRKCKQRNMNKMPTHSKPDPKKRAPTKDKQIDYFNNTDDELDEPELKREDEIIEDIPRFDPNGDGVAATNDGERGVTKKATQVKEECSDYEMDSDSDGIYNPRSVEGGKRKRMNKGTATRHTYNAPSARTQSTRWAAKKARSMTKAGLEIIEVDESFRESEEQESEEDTSQTDEDEDTDRKSLADARPTPEKTLSGTGKAPSPAAHHGAHDVKVPKKIVGLELADPRKRSNFGYHPERNGENSGIGASALGYYPQIATKHGSETVHGLENASYYQPPLSFGSQLSPAASSPAPRQGSNFFVSGSSLSLGCGDTVAPQVSSTLAPCGGSRDDSLFIPEAEGHSPKKISLSEYSDKYIEDSERTFQATSNSSPLRTVDYTSVIDRNEQMRLERQSMMAPDEAQDYLDLDMDRLFDADLENYH